MSFTIDRDALAGALAHVRVALDKDGPAQSQHVALKARAGRLELFASDLVLAAWSSAPCEGELAVCLHGQLLLHAVGALPPGPVTITVSATHRARLASGKARFEVPGTSLEEALAQPGLPRDWASLPAPVLARMVAITRHARSTDTTRPHLGGFALNRAGARVEATATDGHRLALGWADAGGEPFRVFVPGRLADALPAVLKDADGEALVANGTTVRIGPTTLHCPLPEADFPDCSSLVHRTGAPSWRVSIDRQALRDAAEASAAINAREGDKRYERSEARLEVRAGEVELRAENAATGAADVRVEAAVEGGGKPLTVGLNARFLADALAALEGERVDIELDGALDPIVARGADALALIMPKRLG